MAILWHARAVTKYCLTYFSALWIWTSWSSEAGVPDPCQTRRAGLPEQPEGEDEEAQTRHTQHNHTWYQGTGYSIQMLGGFARCRGTERGERGWVGVSRGLWGWMGLRGIAVKIRQDSSVNAYHICHGSHLQNLTLVFIVAQWKQSLMSHRMNTVGWGGGVY